MSVERYFHTERVGPSSSLALIAGGMNTTYIPHNTAELFNPISGAIHTISMSIERRSHKSAFIPNLNRIVLTGGQNSSSLNLATNTGDVFDAIKFIPVENTMIYGHVDHTVTYLPTINKVLIIGGSNGNLLDLIFYDACELYDVGMNRFQSLPSCHMSSKRAGHTATYIPEPYDIVLIVGDENNQTNVLGTLDILNVSTSVANSSAF